MVVSRSSNAVAEYSATFYDMYDVKTDRSFIAKSSDLSKAYNSFDRDTEIRVSFAQGPNVYSFAGRAIGKTQSDMVIIEQTTEIDTENRRKFERDEIRVEVKIYPLLETQTSESRYAIPNERPIITDTSFDVSAGGMCIVTNTTFNTRYDPYYLVEFSITDKELFLLPAKLVRRSNYARSRIGKYDYGFQFLFEHMPEETGRLTKAILSKKLSFFGSRR